MSGVTNKRLNIYIDQASAELALITLQKKADKLTKSIDEGKEAGKKMTTQINKLSETQTAIKDVQKQLDKGLEPSIRTQTTLVQKLKNELKNLHQSDSSFDAKVKQYEKAVLELNRLNEAIGNVGKAEKGITNESSMLGKIGIAGGVAMGNLYTKAAEVAIDTVKRFVTVNAQFEKSVANLSAITGATGKDLEFLKNAAIDLSATTTRSAVDYVEAMKLIASAKPELLANKEALVEVTKAASLLADASGMELPDASKRLTDALNQFGEPASQAAKYVDALAAAAKYGAAEVPDVTDALLQFGSQAKSSNITIYESAAAIELLAEKGIKGAEAGTKLRNVFLAMNAVDGLDKKALDSLEKAGVNTAILSDKTLSLETRLKEFSKIQGNATALVNVFGKENFNAGQIILQNTPRLAELAKQTKETGIANEQAKINTDTLSDAWDRLGNVADAEFLKEGGTFTGFLKGIVNNTTEAIKGLGILFREYKALATFDFGYFKREKDLIHQKAVEGANLKDIQNIKDAYRTDNLGKERKTAEVIKLLQRDLQFDMAQQEDAKAKGDEKRRKQYLQSAINTNKAIIALRRDEEEAKKVEERNKNAGKNTATGGSSGKSSSFDTKAQQELKESLAAARAEIMKGFAAKTNLEAVTYSQPIKPELTIENPDKVLEDGMNLVDKILTDVAKTNRTAGLQLDILKFGLNSKKGFDAQKQLLKEQEEKAIEEAKLAGKTENEIAIIKETFRQQDAQLDSDAFTRKVEAVSSYAQQAIAIFGQISQAQTNRENKAFEAEVKNNNKRRKDIQELEKNKTITGIEARRRLAEIDKEEEQKKEALAKKQFERNKKLSIAQALVNGALAVTSILAQYPKFDGGFAMAFAIGAAIASTAASVATIASSKYAKGGIANGASHSEGGIKLFDTRSKQVVGEMEGDEPYMILSKNFRRNNPDFIAAALDSSMNKNGARISLPQWQSRQYRPIDYAGITSNISKYKFATGGVVGSTNAPAGNNDDTLQLLTSLVAQNTEVMAAHAAATQQLNNQLAKGIRGDWRLNELDDARSDKASILSEANP